MLTNWFMQCFWSGQDSGTEVNEYTAEDGVTPYVTENGSQVYVSENFV
jgi:hypothetical protein